MSDDARPLTRIAEALGDRLNPVLVKEVRQALRGKAFAVSFVLALLLATLGTTTWMLTAETTRPQEAIGLLVLLAFCLTLAVCLQVPLTAFQSLSAEWDGEAMDLLQLTNLRPWGIVFGKLCAAGVQVLLYLCAFVPFLLTTFLMQGVGADTLVWALSSTLSSAATLTGLALALASFGRRRIARVLLILVLVAACVATVFSQLFRVRHLLDGIGFGGGFQTVGLTQLLLSSLWLIYPALLACGIAASRLTHPFEDRSLLPRLVLSVYVIGDLGFAAWRHVATTAGVPAVPGALMSIVLVGVFGLFFTTESDSLPPVRAHGLPKHPRLALVATPFLGGGGRGVLFTLLHLGLIVAGTWIILRVPSAGAHSHGEGFGLVVAAALVIVAWVLLPAAILPRRTEKARFTSRMLVPAIALITTCLPPLALFFMGANGDLEHAGNPLWVVTRFVGDDHLFESEYAVLAVLLLLVAGIGLLANLGRMVEGVREVLEAGAKKRPRRAP